MPSNTLTVAEYVVERLADLGVDQVFGVPGDYTFPFDDAIEASKRVKWVVCANELNAAYAADGYARVNGVSILTTTYGVGELSAINGVMGAKSQRLPVFHLVGAPSTQIQRQGLITHHTLGDGVYNNFRGLSEAACCVSAHLTPDNVIEEMERVIREALRLCAPAYICVPMDLAKMPIIGNPIKGVPLAQIRRVQSDPAALNAAINFILGKVQASKNVVVLPTQFATNYGLTGALLAFLNKSNFPFATTPMDKGVISEAHPSYLGIYNGMSSAPSSVKTLVESADLVLDIGGVVFEDFNTTFWTDSLSSAKLLTIGDQFVRMGNTIFTGVTMGDALLGLTERITSGPKLSNTNSHSVMPLVGTPTDPTSSANLYPRIQRMLKSGDILVVETGTCVLHTTPMFLPDGVGFQTQTLWGSIGWATPAAEGICMANKKGRTILVTGDGSHQLTANEIGVMGRYGLKPIIFVLNNAIYGVENVLSEIGPSYDDLAKWNYAQIPAAMGCGDWFAARVATVAELDAAIEKANTFDGASYIEVMIPASESQPLPLNVQNQIYRTNIPS
ncbi:alpha-keto acid decarboxylase family protein [Polynucleobacter sp. MWH-UH25E]|uniref:alpha-keto acid decarboxylase family protein n=1 Tax=Polynucleobacter sp. MWH-UH25E TaxID=1855616 RepID=UPI001BFD36C8|nr:thiamine pyrophosphate-binding protein [Polynucleobacter sp. MWH-UH25E]QWD62585.1 alpha-keto acid decarboxylase family protein [Polynucleobacter sp. MWH-UH25E]